MNYLKKVGISFIYILSFIIGLTFIFTLLNYIGLLNSTTINIIKVIIPIISMFIGGFIIGKRSSKKGWLEGLKLSIIFLIILSLFNYLGLKTSISLKIFIYYLVLTISTIFGSIIGVNKNELNKKNN